MEDIIKEPTLSELIDKYGNNLFGNKKNKCKNKLINGLASLKNHDKNYSTLVLNKLTSDTHKNTMYKIKNTYFFPEKLELLDYTIHDKANQNQVIDPDQLFKKNFASLSDFKDWFNYEISFNTKSKLNSFLFKFKLYNKMNKNSQDNQLYHSKSKSIPLNLKLKNELQETYEINPDNSKLRQFIYQNSGKQNVRKQKEVIPAKINVPSQLKDQVWYLYIKSFPLNHIHNITKLKLATVKTIIHKIKYSKYKQIDIFNQNPFKLISNEELNKLEKELAIMVKKDPIQLIDVKDKIRELFNKEFKDRQVGKILQQLRQRYKKQETSERNISVQNLGLICKHIYAFYLLSIELVNGVQLHTMDESFFHLNERLPNSQSQIGKRPNQHQKKYNQKFNYSCFTSTKEIVGMQVSEQGQNQVSWHTFMLNCEWSLKQDYSKVQNLIIADAHPIHKFQKTQNFQNRNSNTKLFFLGPQLSFLNCQEIINSHQKRIYRNKKNHFEAEAVPNFVESTFEVTEDQIIGSWIKTMNSWVKYWNDITEFQEKNKHTI